MPTTQPPYDPGYAVRFTTRDDLLRVEVSGDIDAQEVRIAYWRAIAAEARARGVRKLLVTDRKKGQPANPSELAELALLFQEEAKNFDRIAVIEPTVEFMPAVEHAEIFGRGVGINIRIFCEYDPAERWLRYGSPDD